MTIRQTTMINAPRLHPAAVSAALAIARGSVDGHHDAVTDVVRGLTLAETVDVVSVLALLLGEAWRDCYGLDDARQILSMLGEYVPVAHR